MATKLDKDLIRESKIKINDKEVLVTISSTQDILLKLKGSRGKGVSISILDLWYQLSGNENSYTPKNGRAGSISIVKTKPLNQDNKMISLYDLRSANAISLLDIQTKSKFDGIIKDMIENLK